MVNNLFMKRGTIVMIGFEINPNWEELPKPKAGDTVQLILVDIFDYLVNATVTAVKVKKVSVNVQALFDYQTKVPLTGGNKLRLIGKELYINQYHIQNIIKVPTNPSINGYQ
jgi:hypothetical protein